MRKYALKVVRFVRLAFSSEPRDKIRLERRLRDLPLLGAFFKQAIRFKASISQTTANDYLRMQRQSFERYAAADQVEPGNISGDYVVGSWEAHDSWPDYEDFLMRSVPRDNEWIALDFGCGPGRNIRRWSSRFARIDGVDISLQNLENAKVFLRGNIPASKQPNLFLTRGDDCGGAPKEAYDFAFSTICLQHICVHAVRFSILRSMFESLKPGGRLSIQMGYGTPSPNTIAYFEDYVKAPATNRDCDVAIASPDEVRADLDKIGFEKFEYWVRPVGPGDCHPNWIFFTAIKPMR